MDILKLNSIVNHPSRNTVAWFDCVRLEWRVRIARTIEHPTHTGTLANTASSSSMSHISTNRRQRFISEAPQVVEDFFFAKSSQHVTEFCLITGH
jgi:hypothetical protein